MTEYMIWARTLPEAYHRALVALKNKMEESPNA